MNELLIATQKASGITEDLDPNYNLVSLHLRGDVNTGRDYNAFSDASSNNFRLTNNGDVRGSSFSPYGTSWSNYFSGVSDFLSYSTITLGASFTIEFFVYFPTTPSANAVIISNIGAGGTNWVGVSNTAISLSYSAGTRTFAFTPAGGTWYYVQLINSASSLTCYVNGTQVGTAQTGPSSFTLDRVAGYTNVGFTGYLSSVRVNSTALAVSALPTSPLAEVANTVLLTCQSNRLLDNRASPLTLTKGGSLSVSSFSPFLETDTTTGSGYFDGSGDSLGIADNANLDLGNSEFCLELWHYPTAFSSGWLFSKQTSYLTATGYLLRTQTTTGYIEFSAGSSGSSWDIANIVTGQVPVLNAWNHIAITRSSSDNRIRVFLNGALAGITGATTASIQDTSAQFTIGNDSGASVGCTGYISNLRVVKGSVPAAYQTASTTVGTSQIFAPPNAPLTPVANTQLLTLQERGAYNTIGFQDESEYQHVITRPSGANVAQGTFSPFSPNGWSVFFDGTSRLSSTTGSVLNWGAGNFTVEMWVYLTNTSSNMMLLEGPSNNEFQLFVESGILKAGFVGAGVSVSYTLPSTFANTWNHIAVVRSGTGASQVALYVNGVSQSTGTMSSSGAAAGFQIARTSAYTLFGYVAGVRVVKNQALTSGNFTVPVSAVTKTSVGWTGANVVASITGTVSLLLCDSNRLVDSSGTVSAITVGGSPVTAAFSPFAPVAYDPAAHGGSGYFDGSGDYLTVTSADAFDMAGNFTVELWVYPLTLNTPTGASVFCCGNTSLFQFNTLASGTRIEWYANGPATISVSYAGYLQINQWNHLVACRTGTTMAIFVNGTRLGTATDNTSYNLSQLYLSYQPTSAHPFHGYMGGMRVIKGNGPYDATSSTLTVPSGPLPLINNTSLLLNFTNAGVIDSTGKNVIETVGNAGVVTTAIKKYGSGSMFFDGTGDYLYGPSNNLVSFGTGPFTIEGWVYALATPSDSGFFTNGGAATGSLGFYFLTGYLRFDIYSGGGFAASTLLPLNEWVHIACVRSGNTVTLYQNGTSVGSSTITNNNTSSLCYVGTKGWDLTKVFNGYIDDLRITKGYARYVTGTGANANQMVFNGTNTLALPTKALPDRGTASTLTSDLAAPSSVEALVIAGGGGGGYGGASGGGGGAGGFREFVGGSAIAVAGSTNYAISIGAGGVGGTSTVARSDGLPSTFGSVTAIGGGGGGGVASVVNSPGSNGGSGGGGQGNSGNSGAGGKGVYPGSTYLDATRQGYDGGAGATTFHGGGGGGAGGAGAAGSSAAGAGGVGAQSSITGIATFYAGGGGGGSGSGGGTAGNGGGGAGGAGDPSNGSAGTANTGGGGGGARGGTGVGGAGGSGVVIIAYPTSFRPLKASLGLVYTIDTVTRPGYRVYRFTSGTGSISW